MTENLRDIWERLREPFLEEAISVDISGRVGIKVAYVIERLNGVFGLCGMGWWYECSDLEINGEAVHITVRLYYRIGDVTSKPIDAHGSSFIVTPREGRGIPRVGDAIKAATSDGLKKAAGRLGVGHRAYKGLLTDPRRRPQKSPVQETHHDVGNAGVTSKDAKRPLPPETVIRKLRLTAEDKYVVSLPISNAQLGLLVGMIDQATGLKGDAADQARHLFLATVFPDTVDPVTGMASAKNVTVAQFRAIIEAWMDVQKGKDGAWYIASPYAIRELKAIIHWAAKNRGQMDMFDMFEERQGEEHNG